MSEINNSYLRDLRFSDDLESSTSKDILQVYNKENVLQAIFNRIITSKNSLIQRPDYGFGLKFWIEKLASLSNQRDMAVKLKEEVEKDPRVLEVQKVGVQEEGQSTFIISVLIILIGSGAATLEVAADVNNGIITRRI